MSYTPGPGDSETWPMFAGHPHDPRTPENDSDDTTEEAFHDVKDRITDATIEYYKGNRAEFERILREVAAEINAMLGPEE